MKIREINSLERVSGHELEIQPGFLSGYDAICATCFDPDEEGGSWSGVEGIYNATSSEVQDWFADHVAGGGR